MPSNSIMPGRSSTLCCRRSTRWPLALRWSVPGSIRIRISLSWWRRNWPVPPVAIAQRRQQVCPAGRARRRGGGAWCAENAGRRADQDRQGHPLTGFQAAFRPGLDQHPGKRAGQFDHAGQGQPDAVKALLMLCCQVMANDVAIGFAGASGNFELDVCKSPDRPGTMAVTCARLLLLSAIWARKKRIAACSWPRCRDRGRKRPLRPNRDGAASCG